jgi:DNA repair exonuclease SbcCD ATPase subunit
MGDEEQRDIGRIEGRLGGIEDSLKRLTEKLDAVADSMGKYAAYEHRIIALEAKIDSLQSCQTRMMLYVAGGAGSVSGVVSWLMG